MKYGIWRHENALGNSAEQTVNLANFIFDNNDTEPEMYVETPFQKDFCLCIPHVKESSIYYYPKEVDLTDLRLSIGKHKDIFKDIYMPDVYFYGVGYSYPSTWNTLVNKRNILKFPFDIYPNDKKLKENSIVLSIREKGTYWKRVDGANCEPERFVNKETFFKVALHYANKGYTVYRIGDPKQSDMPVHENIIDFAKTGNRRMLDDLYLLATCKCFLSCDSGIWPIAGGLRTKLVLSNVTSAFNNRNIVEWLPKDTSKYIYKQNRQDNSFEQLIEAVDSFL